MISGIVTGRRPLLGTALLDEQELVIQFTEGGLVTIDELQVVNPAKATQDDAYQQHPSLIGLTRQIGD